MSIQALLLGCDGTVFDSEVTFHKILSNVLEDFGVQLTLMDYRRFYFGLSIQRQVATAIRQFSLPINPQILTSIYSYGIERYLQRHYIPAVDGIIETLNFCRQRNIKLALISSSDKDTVLSCLYQQRLADYFDVIITERDTPHSKPAPAGYQLALKSMALLSHNCLAIEATATGIKAARAAGICCAGLKNSYGFADEMISADWVADSHCDIRQQLLQRLSA